MGWRLEVTLGVGMAHSPSAVFGYRDNAFQRWSVAFPDGMLRNGQLWLPSLVESKEISGKAFDLLNKGAKPEDKNGTFAITSSKTVPQQSPWEQNR